MANILIKQYKILGRSKKLIIVSDIILLFIIAITISYYTNIQINKLDFRPIILNEISKSKKSTSTEVIIKNPVEIKCSDIKINSYALYYNKYGDQIGIGPIPPVIGIPTNYWLFFEIKNGDNFLKSMDLYTNLPYNASLAGNKDVSFGNLIINKNNEINWSAIKINKNQTIKIAFEISVTPDKSNLGKVIDIAKNTKIIANDETCKKQILINSENLDTNLKYDSKAKNQGKVIYLK